MYKIQKETTSQTYLIVAKVEHMKMITQQKQLFMGLSSIIIVAFVFLQFVLGSKTQQCRSAHVSAL